MPRSDVKDALNVVSVFELYDEYGIDEILIPCYLQDRSVVDYLRRTSSMIQVKIVQNRFFYRENFVPSSIASLELEKWELMKGWLHTRGRA